MILTPKQSCLKNHRRSLSEDFISQNKSAQKKYISYNLINSLIFTANGLAGINFEHSWGDGVAVMRLIDEIVTDSNKNAFVTPDTVTNDAVGHENVTG
jgi:hypothetical protein